MKSLRSLFTPVLYLLFTGFSVAQSAADSTVLKELEMQIWRPFIQHYNNFDAEKFNQLHAKDVLRGGPWGMRVGEAYFKSNIENDKRSKSAGDKRQIAFRFEHRVTNGNIAYEVGYYRVKSIRNGEEHTYYGRFDVVSKKIKGKWKIAQDWDVDGINGKSFTAADFLGNEAQSVIYE